MALDKNTLWGEICSIFEEKTNKKPTKQTFDLQKDLLQTYTDVYNENPTIQDGDKTFTFQDRMNQVGSQIGVNNPGQVQQSQSQAAGMQAYKDENGDKAFVLNFIDQMVQAAIELRKYVKPNGGVDPRLMYAHNMDQYNSGAQGYTDVDAGYLMKMKDIIDLLSLNFLYYDPNQVDADGKPVDLYQTSYMKNTPKTYRDIALNALKEKASESDLNLRNQVMDYEDLKNYIVNYLTSDSTIIKKHLDGTIWTSKSGTGYKDRYPGYTGKDAKKNFYADHKEMVQDDFFKKLADKLLNAVYGIELDVPDTLFTYGNNKLADDTLVINFTSAHRCPAWNDCLVKNACYAKASEHGYKDLFAKNKQVNMMWEGSKYDQRIMDALKAVIRSHIIDYGKVEQLVKMPAQAAQQKRNAMNQQVMQNMSTDNEYPMVNEAYTPAQMKMIEIVKSHEGFNQLTDEQAEMLRDPKNQMLRARYIRLNEEGDFIGQWLLDAIDEFAGELKRIGVSVAAYTCRNLNYNGIKNIILNASKASIGTNTDGSVANAIARRFYAVPEDFYNSLDETYAPSSAAVKYDEQGNPTTPPVKPTIVNENGEWHIIPYPQPVYADESGQQKNESYYYYKCPCGRGKKEKKTDEVTPVTQRFQDVDLGGVSADKSGINCYDCRMCYEPKSTLTDKPIVVYVQVHSTEKDMFDYKKQKDTGYSKGYQQTRQSLGLNEGVEGEQEEDRETMAYQQIVNNAVWSVNEHLQNLGNINEEKVKEEFNLLLERINNVKF